MRYFRSDLASELHEDYMKEYSKEHSGLPDGIEYEKKQCGGFECEYVKITDERGEKLLKKPVGNYCTLHIGRLWLTDFERFKRCADELSKIISRFIPDNSSVLAVGLGNRYITPDAVGPLACSNIIATHHLKESEPSVYDVSGLGDLVSVAPGVLGQTGIEAVEQIKGIAQRVKPDIIVVIDALAARDTQTLAACVQVTDTGISPGSGVGNNRGELSRTTFGVPTLAIGVPTVIDASSLICQALGDGCTGELGENIKSKYKGMYVTIKDADDAVAEVGRLVGFAINRAVHKILSYEEMMYM